MRLTATFRAARETLCVALALFAVYIAGFGVFDSAIVSGAMVALSVLIAFTGLGPERPGRAPRPAARMLHLLMAVVFVWLVWRWLGIMLEQEEAFVDISRIDYALAWAAFALLGYLTWRLFGIPMLVVYLAMIAYALLPETLFGKGLAWSQVSDRQWFSTNGVYGLPVQVVSTVVLVFIVFGAVLQASGAGDVLLKMAFSATGRIRGGPAHAAIVSSAAFGTMSGAAVANVVSTGIFTIPIIKKAGFQPKFAGAVEASASAGGQIMPPVMGVVAFIMADVTGVPYLSIVVAALVPAIFYYLSLFAVVLIEARKRGVGITPAENRQPITASDWVRSLSFWVPLGVIVAVLLTGRTAQHAGFVALIAALLLCLILFPEFRHPRRWWHALVVAGQTAAALMVIVAAVGLVIGIVNMTGIGLAFADAIRAMAGEHLFPALLMVMLACLIMGMGVPTVTAYLVLALVMGPVLESLGIPKVAAHLFMVYFGVLSVVTPPVALAAFAAAPIAGARPMETGFEATRLSLAGFVIPFVFVYHPDLLIIEGVEPVAFVWAVIAFALSTWMVATAVAGFESRPIAVWERALRIVAGLAVLVPGATVSAPAALVAVALVLLHRWSGRSTVRASPD